MGFAERFSGPTTPRPIHRDGYSRCSQTLDYIQREARTGDMIPRRLVSLIWYIPIFMTWQAERVKGSVDIQEYQRIANQIEGKIEEILGIP